MTDSFFFPSLSVNCFQRLNEMPKPKVITKQAVKMPPGADEFRKLMQEAARAEQHQVPALQIVAKEGVQGETPAATAAASGAAAAPQQITPQMVKRWKVVYPVYLNKARTCAEGRRVTVDIAIENPTPLQVAAACVQLGYTNVAIEPRKCYPREFGCPGRVRVMIYDEDRKPLIPGIKNTRELLVAIAKTIPELPPPPTRQLTAKEQKAAAKKAAKKRR